jgi:hypothetical protein
MNKSIKNFIFIILCTVMLIYTAMKKTSRSIHSTTGVTQIHLSLLRVTHASSRAQTHLLYDWGSPEILFSHINTSQPREACTKSCLVSLYIVQYSGTRKLFAAQATEFWRLDQLEPCDILLYFNFLFNVYNNLLQIKNTTQCTCTTVDV